MSDDISHIASEIITQTYKPPQPNIVMQRKALAINITVILVAMVATLLILLGLTRVGSGQLNRGIDSAINGVQDMFSMCDNLGPKDFKTFIAKIKEIYDDCKKDKNKCDRSACKKMTLTSTSESCYKVNGDVLASKAGFSTYNAFLTGALSLSCNYDRSTGFLVSEGISLYNKKASGGLLGYKNQDEAYCVEDISANLPGGGGSAYRTFAVAKNDIIKISPYKKDDKIFLKIEINGGDKIDPNMNVCTDISESECENDADCNSKIAAGENNRIYCSLPSASGIRVCKRDFYCQHVCDNPDGLHNDECTTDPANPDKKKCIKITTTCDGADGACSSQTAVCENGIKTTITNYREFNWVLFVEQKIQFTTDPILGAGINPFIVLGSDMGYTSYNTPTNYVATMDLESTNAKMSLGFFDFSAGTATIYQGCY